MGSESTAAARLKNEALLGAGLTSEVFTWGDGRVLKLFSRWVPVANVQREFAATQAVQSTGLPVPRVFEMVRIEQRHGIVFERVRGESMLRRVERKPWTLFAGARQLADLHARIHACAAPSNLPTQRAHLERRIDSAEEFTETRRNVALSCVARLPSGDSLCHGDFHPGNILLTPNGPVVIDWSGATRGSALADVARTSVLFERAKLPPDTPFHIRLLMMVAREALHSTYLRRYFELRPGDQDKLEECRVAQRLAGEAWWAGRRAAIKRSDLDIEDGFTPGESSH